MSRHWDRSWTWQGATRQASGMAKKSPSVGDLRRKSQVTDDEINVATAASTGYAWRMARTAAAA